MRVFGGYFRTTVAAQLQYRAVLVIWLLDLVLQPVIALGVWSAVARSRGETVGGFGPAEFAAYFLAVMVVDHLTFTWIMWEYDYRIRHGDFSTVLLRPIHPVVSDLADNVAYKLLTLVVLSPVVALLVWLFRPSVAFVPWAVAAFVPALVLAFALRFALEWTLAMAAFWTTRISAVNNLYWYVFALLAGFFAPLSLLPGPLRAIAEWLPFRWVMAFPVELLLGRLRPEEAAVGFAAQLAWIGIGVVALRAAYGAGVRRYAAVGG